MRWVPVIVFAAGCGRVGFDPDPGRDAGDDAAGTPPAALYYADNGLVHRVDFATGSTTTVVDRVGTPNGLTFDATRTTLYISDDTNDQIFAADAPAFEARLVFDAGTRVEGLALDAAGTTIYYAAKQIGEVRAIDIDGQSPRTVRSGLGSPDGVALLGDTLYVTSIDGYVARMRTDGSGFEMIVTGLTGPEGIAIDVAAGHVYFVDRSAVRRVDLDGSNQQTLVASPVVMGEGLSLDLLHGHVYWSDSTSNDVWRANLDGSEVTQIVRDLVLAEDVAVGP